MGLLKNFFTRKKEKNDTKQTQENYLPISNILEDLKEKNIIIQSKVPQSVMLGNMIFEKKYKEAINLMSVSLFENKALPLYHKI